MNDNDLDEFEQAVIENVRKYGCHITRVVDDEGDDPDFAYSIGFPETLKQPDVIVFGLKPKVMQHMINELYEQCKDGLVMEEGLQISGLLQGHDCILMAVDPSHMTSDYFGAGFWYYDHMGLPDLEAVFQIVWPGAKDGLFPWDTDCAEIVIDSQPPLFIEWTEE